jgi:hypothetical protein
VPGDEVEQLHRKRRYAAHMHAAETHDRARRLHLAGAERLDTNGYPEQAEHERALANDEGAKTERARRIAWWALRRN